MNEENTIEKIDKYIFIRNHIQKVKKVYNERGLWDPIINTC